jgi:hypothetical protein
MVYVEGAETVPNLIETIANALIAYPNWEEGDPTWDISDMTGDNARRSLKYIGDAADVWIALESLNATHRVCNYHTNGCYDYSRAKGIRVTVSDAWAANAPSGTIYEVPVMFEMRVSTNWDAVSADFATMLMTYYLWYDETGFVITAKPEPITDDNVQNSFFLCVEHCTKLYNDSQTNFFITAYQNRSMVRDTDDTHCVDCTRMRFRSYTRPFLFQNYHPDGNHHCEPWWDEGNGMTQPIMARKSHGNSKVYYTPVLYQNEAGANKPIAESKLWFRWEEGIGLIDGEIVSIEGETTKYICKALASPDSTNRLPIAMKYVS